MCNPALALMAAATLYQTQQQAKLADQQEESVKKSGEIQQAAIDEQGRQDAAATGEQMSEAAIAARQAHARLMSVAGEHGIGGGTSLDAQSQEIDANNATDLATMASNLGRRATQRGLDGSGVAAQTNSRLNQIQQPDWIGAGLKIGSAYFASQAAAEKPDASKAAPIRT